PPCDRTVCSISARPNPCPRGALTFGPSLSFQVRYKLHTPLVRTSQVTDSRPAGTERAPYLRALVASSCSTSAKCTAACGSSASCGPEHEILSPLAGPASPSSFPPPLIAAAPPSPSSSTGPFLWPLCFCAGGSRVGALASA